MQRVAAGVEQSRSHGCRHENLGFAARNKGWRFRVVSGSFAAGAPNHVVIAVSPKGEASALGSPSKAMPAQTHAEKAGAGLPVAMPASSAPATHGVTTSSVTTAAGMAPAMGTSPNESQEVAGTQFTGGSGSGATAPQNQTALGGTPGSTGSTAGGENAVVGASGSNGESAGAAATAPASAFASRSTSGKQLPFTGISLVVMLLAAAGCLTSGLALRRVGRSQS